MYRLILLISVVLMLGSVSQALTNGDFNTGDLTGWWTYLSDPDNQDISVQSDYTYDGTPNAQIWTNSGESCQLGQEFDIATGQQLTVSLVYSTRYGTWGGAGVGIDYYDASWTWLDYDWETLYSDGPGPGEGNWVPWTSPSWSSDVAGVAYASLKIHAWNWNTNYFDNVVLVPEPATMLLLGLGGLSLLRIRKKN